MKEVHAIMISIARVDTLAAREVEKIPKVVGNVAQTLIAPARRFACKSHIMLI